MRWSKSVKLKSPGTEKTSFAPISTSRRARCRPSVPTEAPPRTGAGAEPGWPVEPIAFAVSMCKRILYNKNEAVFNFLCSTDGASGGCYYRSIVYCESVIGWVFVNCGLVSFQVNRLTKQSIQSKIIIYKMWWQRSTHSKRRCFPFHMKQLCVVLKVMSLFLLLFSGFAVIWFGNLDIPFFFILLFVEFEKENQE